MKAGMSQPAVSPSLPDAASEPEFRPTGRERLGVGFFVVVAVLFTAGWIAAIAWGAVQLIEHL
jgi:hypothetical protein